MAWYVYAGIAIASYVYHRWTAETPPKPNPARNPILPRVDEGASYTLIYGRCRVRSPVLAWHNRYPRAQAHSLGFNYRLDHYQVLGIPFEQAQSRLWGIWVGDVKLVFSPTGNVMDIANGLLPHDGAGFPGDYGVFVNTPPAGAPAYNTDGSMGSVGGFVQFYDGRATQKHTDPADPWTIHTLAGRHMKFVPGNGNRIPGYRGYLSVMHCFAVNPDGVSMWAIGDSPNLGGYSYEVSSYPGDSDAFNVGIEANPSKVLIDLLTGTNGKLGLPASMLDSASFLSAKIRLQEEGNGYSRAIEAGVNADEIIREILEQIDGVLYEDNRDGKIHIKLVRPDYSVSALPHITADNCVRLEGFSAALRIGLPNKVRVVYTDRAREYQEASATAHNQALATNDGVREVVLQFPGVCTAALAGAIASRELSARSRPLAKCTAVVNREFYAVAPGDPVKLTWPEYGIDGRVFRVAAVNRGELAKRSIRLDLIEDFFHAEGRLITKDPHDLGDLPPFEQTDPGGGAS